MSSSCEAVELGSRSGLSRPSQDSRCKPCKGVTGQPRAQALGAGVKPEPNPVGVKQKPVPPLQPSCIEAFNDLGFSTRLGS